jgi:hypothetical protein
MLIQVKKSIDTIIPSLWKKRKKDAALPTSVKNPLLCTDEMASSETLIHYLLITSKFWCHFEPFPSAGLRVNSTQGRLREKSFPAKSMD